MTTTQIITNATVGALGTYGSNASVTTLQSSTLRLSVSVQMTNGAHSGDLESFLRVYMATSALSMTAAAATQALRKQAKYWDIRPHPTPSAVTCENIGPIIPQGQYCYVWTEEPKFSASGTLNAWLVEVMPGTGDATLDGAVKAAGGAAATSSVQVEGVVGGTPQPISSTAITATGTKSTTAITAQEASPILFSVEVVHETGKTMNANDVIGPLTTPADASTGTINLVAGQPVRITQLHLKTNSVVATMLAGQVRAHFYNGDTGVAPIAGNSQNTMLYANGLKRVGYADFLTFKTAGTGSDMCVAIGVLQGGGASFLDCFPVSQNLTFRLENLITGTVLSTGQKFTLMGSVTPL